MRVAFYGGSFNPPHVAHAMVASWLLWTDQVDAVWMVPVYRHAFEGIHDKALAPFEARLGWCRALARDLGVADPTAPDARLRVLDVEAHLPVPSFTIDTLRHLRDRHPQVQLRPVVGADVLPQLPRWRQWDQLQREFPPVVVGRVGYPGPPDAVVFPAVSSSEVRRRLRAGLPADTLLTSQVLRALRADQPRRLWPEPGEP